MRSFASLMTPAGITSIRLSKFKSKIPSKLITSCFCAKNAATQTPKRPPRMKTSELRRLWDRFAPFFNSCSLAVDTTLSSSPTLLFSWLGGVGMGDGEGEGEPKKRRRSEDIKGNRIQLLIHYCEGEKRAIDGWL